MIFFYKFLQVCGKKKGDIAGAEAGAGTAICNFSFGSGRQFNFSSSALGSGSKKLTRIP
jgi:hypothetical protein